MNKAATARVIQFRDMLDKVVAMLVSRRIRVTQVGVKAFVTYGKDGMVDLVNLPYIADDAGEEIFAAIRGFLDHEVAHVLFTVARQRPDKRCPGHENPKALHKFYNMIEDTRIEVLMRKQFRGSQRHIDDTIRFVLNRLRPSVETAVENGDVRALTSMLIMPLVRHMAGQKVATEFFDDMKLWKVIEPLYEPLRDLEPTLRALTCTADATDLALVMYDRCKAPPPPPEPEPESQPDQEPEEQQDGEGDTDDTQESDDGDDSAASSDSSDDAEDNEGDDDGNGGTTDDEPEGDTEDDTGEGQESGKADDAGTEDDAEETGDGAEAGEDDAPESDDDGDGTDGSDSDGEADDDDGDGAEGAGGDDDDAEPGDEDGDGAGGSGGDDTDDDAEPEEGEGSGSGADDGEEDEEGEERGGSGGSGDGDADDDDAEGEGDDGDASDDSTEDEEEPAQENARLSLTDLDAEDITDAQQQLANILSVMAMDGASNASYLSWTTDWDTWERIEHKGIPDPVLDNEHNMIREKLRAVEGKMCNELRRLFAQQSLVMSYPGYRSGKLTPSTIHRVPLGESRVFSRKVEHHATATAITLLIDCSGSMFGNKIKIASECALMFAKTLDKIGIRYEILGFTTNEDQASRKINAVKDKIIAQQVEMDRQFSRLTPIRMYEIKAFDEKLNAAAIRNIIAVGGTTPLQDSNGHWTNVFEPAINMGANVDGESVMLAARRLLREREPRKVMMVLSDGYPSAGVMADLKTHLSETVKTCETMGVEMLGIGIASDAVKDYYPKSVVIQDPAELMNVVMGELRGMLIGKQRRAA